MAKPAIQFRSVLGRAEFVVDDVLISVQYYVWRTGRDHERFTGEITFQQERVVMDDEVYPILQVRIQRLLRYLLESRRLMAQHPKRDPPTKRRRIP